MATCFLKVLPPESFFYACLNVNINGIVNSFGLRLTVNSIQAEA